MSGYEKRELSSMVVSERNDPTVSAYGGAGKDAISIVEKQTRTRRLFSFSQLFSFSLVYLGTWYCTAM